MKIQLSTNGGPNQYRQFINKMYARQIGLRNALIDGQKVKFQSGIAQGIIVSVVLKGVQTDHADDDQWLRQANRIGYPIMVKASGGGGGKGIRVVYSSDTLLESIQSAQREAQQAFGDSRIFLERYIEHGRHIEIQILADTQGNTVHLFERECSTQRRHQKIIEESPSPLLTDAIRQQMGESAVQAGQAVNYVNAGTVEFIATPDGEYFFLEMNTRLQVEHPVTEMVTGLDLVKLQFQIANGQPLPFTQADLSQRGHAIECRLYAEDPRNQFLPAIGTIHRFVAPSGNGIRVDSGIQSGDDITIHYDPMIAKLIVHDRDRESAIQRMIIALRDTIILGTTTNLDFLLSLIDNPTFRKGEVHTRFVDDNLDALLPDIIELDDLALIVSALHELQGQAKSSTDHGTSDGDSYSPWNRADNFRI